MIRNKTANIYSATSITLSEDRLLTGCAAGLASGCPDSMFFSLLYQRLFSLYFLEIWFTRMSSKKLITVLNRLTAEEKLYWLLSSPIL